MRNSLLSGKYADSDIPEVKDVKKRVAGLKSQ